MSHKTYQVVASAVINAHADAIYAVISDYRGGHRAILPQPYFVDMEVEKGGKGAGTVLLVKMRVWGQDFTYHQIVSEPEPGRVLVETDLDTGQFTRFTLEPLNNGQQTRVTIYSEFPMKPGITGWMEKLMQPPVARGIYHKELRNLETYLAAQQPIPTMG